MAAPTEGGAGRKEITLAKGRFTLKARLGSGSFGEIFSGYDMEKKRDVAIKLERAKQKHSQLFSESRIYSLLHGSREVVLWSDTHPGSPPTLAMQHAASFVGMRPPGRKEMRLVAKNSGLGIPRTYWYGTEGEYNCLAMDLCGPSLEMLFNYCCRSFSLKTVVMLAEQLLHRIEYVHSRGLIHRDIKPENFCLGGPATGNIVYLLDYGLAKRYIVPSATNVKERAVEHVPFSDKRNFTGTLRYCGGNVHRGFEQSRRDDLESIGYTLVYFLRGRLPWQGVVVADPAQKESKTGERKLNTTVDELCSGLPGEFAAYFTYVLALKFEEKPDYRYLRALFHNVAYRCGIVYDGKFDWIAKRLQERRQLLTEEGKQEVALHLRAMSSQEPPATNLIEQASSNKPRSPTGLGSALMDGVKTTYEVRSRATHWKMSGSRSRTTKTAEDVIAAQSSNSVVRGSTTVKSFVSLPTS